MKRRQPCDGCGANRKRWQRLCDTCFATLPADVRTGLIQAHRGGRMADWRRFVRQAQQMLSAGRIAAHTGVTAQTAYARNAALLGERDR